MLNFVKLMEIQTFSQKSHFALPGKVTLVECACSPRLSASLNGAATKDIFLLRGALARRENISQTYFRRAEQFYSNTQEIRSWLRTLLNQLHFNDFGARISRNPPFRKISIFIKKTFFMERLTSFSKVIILHQKRIPGESCIQKS